MNKNIFSSLDLLPYFTIESVKQLFGDGASNAATLRTVLYRWMKTDRVIQLKKGVYMPRRFYELHRREIDFSLAVSAILLPQSYLSLEFILQRHAILTEVTYPVSAITLKNTLVIENKLGSFTYRHIKPALYRGFSISECTGILFAQASPAKALFDYLYLRPVSGLIRSPAYNLAEELRLNLDNFSLTDQDEFASYVETSQVKKMEPILKNLRRSVWRL